VRVDAIADGYGRRCGFSYVRLYSYGIGELEAGDESSGSSTSTSLGDMGDTEDMGDTGETTGIEYLDPKKQQHQ